MRTTTRRLSTVAAIVVTLALLAPAFAMAASVRSGNQLIISRRETVRDDLYAAGYGISVAGRVDGDFLGIGGVVVLNGPISGSAMIVANSVVINGPVGGSLRVLASNVTLSGRVRGDVLIYARNVDISEKTRIGRDLLVSASRLRLDGRVKRNLSGNLDQADISGRIGQDANMSVGNLNLASSARIDGDLVYGSSGLVTISRGAAVRGEVQRVIGFGQSPFWRFLRWLWSLASLVLVGTLLALMYPSVVLNTAETISSRFWLSLAVGLGVLVGLPLGAVAISIVTGTLALPLALILLALYLIVVYASSIFVAALLGRWTIGAVKGDRDPSAVAAVIIGLFALSIAGAVPYLGTLVKVAVLILGTGAFPLTERRIYRQAREAGLF